MVDVDIGIMVNLSNIQRVWGRQSVQFKDALDASGLSLARFLEVEGAERQQQQHQQRQKCAMEPILSSSPSSPTADLNARTNVHLLDQSFQNLALGSN